jgi:ABC-type oligopeptide transport system ATPase subunit
MSEANNTTKIMTDIKKTHKLETYKKKTNIKSFEHETNTIQRALDAISIDVSKYKSINLIGDKGCNTKKKLLYKVKM